MTGSPKDLRAAMVGAVFESVFGAPPEAVRSAPGRVNLLGEHTDYNDGHVLPIAIEQRTTVALRRSREPGFSLHARTFSQTVRFSLHRQPEQHFAAYVYGCLCEAEAAGIPVPPLQILVMSEVPMGVGLSSSAALEVAALRALCALTGVRLDEVRLAQLAQRAEREHVGVRCGIMDQMAASLAGTEQALWLDTRTLQRKLVPLPRDSAVLVLDSGMPRTLAAGGYNMRRAECELAAGLLGVFSLRDVDDPGAAGALPDPLGRRVRHVVTENSRVLRAVETTSAAAFGALMNESHASLRDDYEVSTPELDQLVALLQRHPAVYGARLTGAGFGGACVALCRPAALRAVAGAVLAAYASAGKKGQMLVPFDA